MSILIKDAPWLTKLLDKEKKRNSVPGICANCNKTIYEDLWVLDDAFGVWRGKCPYCNAINLLDFDKALRGYWSGEMYLCLPTDHEIKINNWGQDIPYRKCDCKECKFK